MVKYAHVATPLLAQFLPAGAIFCVTLACSSCAFPLHILSMIGGGDRLFHEEDHFVT
jgi:hypothetical protein